MMSAHLYKEGWESYLGSRLERAQVVLVDHIEEIQQQLDKKFQCMEMELHTNINNTPIVQKLQVNRNAV
ncbi:hypothetical protein AALO_G00287630 [Alosa alosa]|uniref:Uncharacterized protein n=1 Tax=Alosa alosa TaxID=278164 RepID=A0AAV6FFZ7_9TELE|nr:hypothetical protein AALO_G00287630 [Alosa alosa]